MNVPPSNKRWEGTHMYVYTYTPTHNTHLCSWIPIMVQAWWPLESSLHTVIEQCLAAGREGKMRVRGRERESEGEGRERESEGAGKGEGK